MLALFLYPRLFNECQIQGILIVYVLYNYYKQRINVYSTTYM